LEHSKNIIINTSTEDIIENNVNANNLKYPYLYELKLKIHKDIKRIVCKQCGFIGHCDKSRLCKDNIIINKKIRNYLFRNDNYSVKYLSILYNKPQCYINDVIRGVSKMELIENKKFIKQDLDLMIADNIKLCDLCRKNTYHVRNNRIWNDKNVCDECWCSYEDDREDMWNVITSLFSQECNICSNKREHMKIRFHYDHINMFNKCGSICSMVNNGCDIISIKDELKKCQNLCISCHNIISDIENKLGFTSYKISLVKRLNNGEINNHEYNKEFEDMYNIYELKMKNIYKLMKTLP
jgi:hypothetical protein